jgi:hypothetical protein
VGCAKYHKPIPRLSRFEIEEVEADIHVWFCSEKVVDGCDNKHGHDDSGMTN